jgi:hypothetical protein
MIKCGFFSGQFDLEIFILIMLWGIIIIIYLENINGFSIKVNEIIPVNSTHYTSLDAKNEKKFHYSYSVTSSNHIFKFEKCSR